MVLRAELSAKGGLIVHRCQGQSYCERHVLALKEALETLDVQMPMEVWLGIDDSVESLKASLAFCDAEEARMPASVAVHVESGLWDSPYAAEYLEKKLADYAARRKRVHAMLTIVGEGLPPIPPGTRITAAEAAERARALRLEAAKTLVAG